MFRAVREVINSGRRFLVTTHIDPDGDAIGSAFALCFALGSMGKEAVAYLKDDIPYKYQFLPRPPRVVHHELPNESYDATFVLDCGNLFRVGEGYESLKSNGVIVNIDHHVTSDAFGQVNVVEEGASSTSEILYLILKALGVQFNLDIAVNLYTAILTDTGSFRYDSTTKRAFSICEEMVGLGVGPAHVAAEVYESHPKERYRLLCLVLTTLELVRDNRIATAFVTKEMFDRTETNREYTEGFVEFIKEIKGIDVACFIREIGEQKFKISMRSKGDVDVASVAHGFGGGGHQKAAGCIIEGTIDEVKNKLVGAIVL